MKVICLNMSVAMISLYRVGNRNMIQVSRLKLTRLYRSEVYESVDSLV